MVIEVCECCGCQVDGGVWDARMDKPRSGIETLVGVYGYERGLGGVCVYVVVVRGKLYVGLRQCVEACLLGDAVEIFATDNLGTRVGEKTFVFVGEGVVQNVGRYEGEYGVAQKFKSFVVDFTAILVGECCRAMGEGQLVKFDAAGIEYQQAAE